MGNIHETPDLHDYLDKQKGGGNYVPWCVNAEKLLDGGTASPVMHKYIKYPLKWALQNKLRSMQGKTVCLDKKWCDVGQDPCQGDLREKF